MELTQRETLVLASSEVAGRRVNSRLTFMSSSSQVVSIFVSKSSTFGFWGIAIESVFTASPSSLAEAAELDGFDEVEAVELPPVPLSQPAAAQAIMADRMKSRERLLHLDSFMIVAPFALLM